MTKLLSIQQDAKTSRNANHGYLTGIQYLLPANMSGKEFCPFRSKGCTLSCLAVTSGRMVFDSVRQAQRNRSNLFIQNKAKYFAQLHKEIGSLIRKAEKLNLKPSLRLNGSSDLPWERIKDPATGETLIETYKDVQFYDYTKDHRRPLNTPENYFLAFSKSEDNSLKAYNLLKQGASIAVVVTEKVDKIWNAETVDGDAHDLIFLHGQGKVIQLSAKGKARQDDTGFVLNTGFIKLAEKEVTILNHKSEGTLTYENASAPNSLRHTSYTIPCE